MSEDLPNRDQTLEREWQAPPPPIDNTPPTEPPQMTDVGTLGSIFYEPGATFADLRRKPRFLMAGLIIVLLCGTYNTLFTEKVGFERVARERLESSSWFQNQPREAQNKTIEMQTGPIFKSINYASVPLVILIFLLIGGLLYWGAANAMGGSMSFLRGLAVWVYATFPPLVVQTLANILVLFLKSTDDIDAVTGQNGLIQASPAMLVDAKQQEILSVILGTFDLFLIWGWILAAIGLRITGKLSTGAAWGIVLIGVVLNIAVRLIVAVIS